MSVLRMTTVAVLSMQVVGSIAACIPRRIRACLSREEGWYSCDKYILGPQQCFTRSDGCCEWSSSALAVATASASDSTCHLQGAKCDGVSALCCSTINKNLIIAEMQSDFATAKRLLANERKACAAADMAAMSKCDPSTLTMMVAEAGIASASDSTCQLPGSKCDGVSAGCCTTINDNHIWAGMRADAWCAANTACAADTAARQRAQIAACAADTAALSKCDGQFTLMLADEPQQMLAGFGGFLAGAALVGLATGLKKRSQTAIEQPLTA